MTVDFLHIPVLLSETIEALKPGPGGQYVDATLGGAGHAEKMLERSGPDGRLLGIDADPAALGAAQKRLAPFGERVTLRQSYFDRMSSVAAESHFESVNGILFDLGISSPQVDHGDRGFSFQRDAPLDMRMGPDAGATAAELVNTLSAAELQTIFSRYGEERFSRRIAEAIVAERTRRPLNTTAELVSVIRSARPDASREPIHPATRVFQALRIAVNDELGRLERALPQAVTLLATGGRLAVITFHSLEDRIVKHFIRHETQECVCPPHVPVCVCGHRATLLSLTRRPLMATPAETARNPRARSAKLRVAERLPLLPTR